MFYPNRRYSIKPVTPEEMIEVKEHTWCLCNSWSIQLDGETFLLLNDASSEDGALELGICRVIKPTPSGYIVEQRESLTLSWVDSERIPATIIKCCEELGFRSKPFEVRADNYTEHQCFRCA